MFQGAGEVSGIFPKSMSYSRTSPKSMICSMRPSLRAGTVLLLNNLLQEQELIQVTFPRSRRSFYLQSSLAAGAVPSIYSQEELSQVTFPRTGAVPANLPIGGAFLRFRNSGVPRSRSCSKEATFVPGSLSQEQDFFHVRYSYEGEGGLFLVGMH
jgi:hypothetical protein